MGNTRDVKRRGADPFTREADARAQGSGPLPEYEPNLSNSELGIRGLTDERKGERGVPDHAVGRIRFVSIECPRTCSSLRA